MGKKMRGNDHDNPIFRKLRIGINVDLLAQPADELEEKADVRRSRILDIVPPHVIIEQPEPKLPPRRVGDTLEVSYLAKDNDGALKRAIVKMRLVNIDRYQLKGTFTEALFFVPSSDVYYGTLRRHYRVEIPQDENIVLIITNLKGKRIGLQPTYKVVDLSLQGLKFFCPRTVHHKGKIVQEPVGRLSKNDKILVKLFINNTRVLWANAIIRAKIVPHEKTGNAVYFGIEFLKSLTIDENTKKIRLETYCERHRNTLLPHINNLQRKLLRKQGAL